MSNSQVTGNTDPSDVVLNRYNLLQARSRKVLESWLPPRQPTDNATQKDEEEEDFKSMSETAGIGSKTTMEDDEASSAGVLRKGKASNDKLLEQLLGSKAARAKKKSSENRRVSASTRRFASRQQIFETISQSRVESEDEDEGGRTTVLSRKPRNVVSQTASRERDLVDINNNSDCREEPAATPSLAQGRAFPPVHQTDSNGAVTSKRTTSYLDELLAQKSRKKRKKAKN